MIASLVIIGVSVLIVLAILLVYMLSRGKYRDMIKPLNKKNYAFLFMMPAGLYILDLIKYSYTEGDRKLRDSFSELYGDKYALFYLRIHIANKLAAVMVFLVLICSFSFYLNAEGLYAEAETPPVSLNGNTISRPEFNPETYKNGDASIDIEAMITVDDSTVVKSYNIKVPMQMPEDRICVDLVLKDLEENFIQVNQPKFEDGLSSNLSFKQFGTPLGCDIILQTESEQAYLSESGALTQPGPEVKDSPVLRACLVVSKGDVVKRTSMFSVKILPMVIQIDYEGELDKVVQDINNNKSEAIGNKVIEMPVIIDNDAQVSWSPVEKPADNTKYIIFICGLFVVALIFVMMDSDIEKNIKKKREFIKRDFPEFISKFVLLLGCGMTSYDSFRKIMEDNKNVTKTFENHPIYMELETTLREIDLGKAEIYAYEDFGLRCRITEAMKFSSLVTQNLRRGTDDLLMLLREQVSDVWQLHKADIRRKGEEAGTKLVFPMILSLVSVLLVVIYPAFASINF